MSRTVWGFVHSRERTLAAYFVQWTLNNAEHGANFDLILGWPGDRQAVALEYRVVDGRGAFMVIDAGKRPVANSDLAQSLLKRDQIIGQPIAQDVFSVVDTVFVKDERLQEIRNWS
jgi:hypothetical protein